ncbi:ABC transporter ATP-binding protein [Actinoplanes teichomyceticus]|uniref:ABC transporter family protein n=1 Tax=Actinoplanes teichomyceticus TaxID=1867 RepID=A0A561WNA0_ACTTI|nr:ATP-binding cassette domain-containing protein [Actinoplanes teichomyceticus]TWG25351.1 ABC transporter family protein [Actinoplanes teichomyceticus]GIF10419.1 hypothetical protein Ate01nite_04510 [Actinoplanes teichomyceticus]
MAVLRAMGAGVRHHRRWLVRDLDLVVEPGETVAVVGPPGSGRTSTLLALAGSLRLSAGTVALSGTAALGHVAGVTDPEPVLTVLEHVRERLALLGRPRREAGSVPLHGLDPGLRGRDLTPYQKQILGLVLAGPARPAVVALDGVDAGLDAGERTALWDLLGSLTAGGVAVLVTAREVDAARVSRVVRLSDPQAGEPGRAVVQTPQEYAAGRTGPCSLAEWPAAAVPAEPARAHPHPAVGPTASGDHRDADAGPAPQDSPVEGAEGGAAPPDTGGDRPGQRHHRTGPAKPTLRRSLRRVAGKQVRRASTGPRDEHDARTRGTTIGLGKSLRKTAGKRGER